MSWYSPCVQLYLYICIKNRTWIGYIHTYIYIKIPRTSLQIITDKELEHCCGLSRHSPHLSLPSFCVTLCYLAKNKGALGTQGSHGQPHDKHQALVLATHKQGWGVAACVCLHLLLQEEPGLQPFGRMVWGRGHCSWTPSPLLPGCSSPGISQFLA